MQKERVVVSYLQGATTCNSTPSALPLPSEYIKKPQTEEPLPLSKRSIPMYPCRHGVIELRRVGRVAAATSSGQGGKNRGHQWNRCPCQTWTPIPCRWRLGLLLSGMEGTPWPIPGANEGPRYLILTSRHELSLSAGRIPQEGSGQEKSIRTARAVARLWASPRQDPHGLHPSPHHRQPA